MGGFGFLQKFFNISVLTVTSNFKLYIINTGALDILSFVLLKAFCYSIPHVKLTLFFNSLNRGPISSACFRIYC